MLAYYWELVKKNNEIIMKNKIIFTVLVFFTLLINSNLQAASPEEKRIGDAADILDQLLRIPEKAATQNLLSRAYAVAVIPDVVKAAFGIGARRGKGIIVIRQNDNSWSNPAFITLTGGSIGWQVGAQSTDIILVFKTRKGVEGIENGSITLGADASIAAGPMGRHTGALTDIEFKSEVFSYSRSRGLFAGVSLEGSNVTMDRKANVAFYNSPDMTPERIFVSSPNIVPNIANTFVQILSAQTSQLPTQPGMNVESTNLETNENQDVQIFGIPNNN
tara:strand:+ start:669 stop:1496 length:828 start_codon:yes stop_codon:yes gene_type:complete